MAENEVRYDGTNEDLNGDMDLNNTIERGAHVIFPDDTRTPSMSSLSTMVIPEVHQKRWDEVDDRSKSGIFVVECDITDPGLFTLIDSMETRVKSSSFHWRGVKWDILIAAKFERTLYSKPQQVFYYFGIEDPSELPVDFSFSPQFTVSLLSSNEGDNTPIVVGKTYNRDSETRVKYEYSTYRERCDLGDSMLLTKVWPRIEMDCNLHYQSQTTGERNNQHWSQLKPFKLRLLVQLRSPFQRTLVSSTHDSKLSTGMVGINNLGATCYLNALLQMLFHLTGFRRLVFAMPHQEEGYGQSTTLGLQEVFKNLLVSRKSIDTMNLLKAFGWTSAEASLQQDLQEMMRVLLDKIEEKAKGTNVDGRIQEMFCGKVRSFIECENVEYKSNREEEFYDIQLDVKGCNTMIESFRKYTESEMLEGENQYDAGAIFTKLPPVLTIHLKRFDFDFEHMGYKKIHDYFSFPVWANLDEFIAKDAADEFQKDNDYILHSVLVHSGDFGAGHYYAYIRPNLSLASGGNWYKFDDDFVYAVDDTEAIDFCFGHARSGFTLNMTQASAYMLIYVRASHVKETMRPFDPRNTNDIPSDLMSRLHAENQVKRLQELRKREESSMLHLNYATASELHQFSPAMKDPQIENLVSKSLCKTMRLRSDTSGLAILMEICDQMKTSPYRVCLYRVRLLTESFSLGVDSFPRSRSDRKMRRISGRFTLQMLSEPICKIWESTSVKTVRYVLVEQASKTNILRHEREENLFNEEYESLRIRETEWLHNLREILLSSNGQMMRMRNNIKDSAYSGLDDKNSSNYDQIENITKGYGIGSSSSEYWQELVRGLLEGVISAKNIQSTIDDLKTRLEDIESDMLKLLEKYTLPFEFEDLLILKVFDPTGRFDSVIEKIKEDEAHVLKPIETGTELYPPEPMTNDLNFAEKMKFLKFLSFTRCQLGASLHGIEDTCSIDGNIDERLNHNRENSLSVSYIVQKAISDIPCMPNEFIRTISQWKYYVGRRFDVEENDLLDAVDPGILRKCCVVIIDPCFGQSIQNRILRDNVSKLHPNIDTDLLVWAKYAVYRRNFECRALEDGYSHAALRISLKHHESSNDYNDATDTLGSKRKVAEPDTLSGEGECSSTHMLVKFHIETVSKTPKLSDIADAIALETNIDHKHLLLWFEKEENLDTVPELELTLESNLSCYGGVDEEVPANILRKQENCDILFSVSPYCVVDGERQLICNPPHRICVTITDSRLLFWRRLLIDSIRKRIGNRNSSKKARVAFDKSQSSENFAIPLNDVELNKSSNGSAFFLNPETEFSLQYSEDLVSEISSMEPSIRELHLLPDTLFSVIEPITNWGDRVLKLRHALGVVSESNQILDSLRWKTIEDCKSIETLGGENPHMVRNKMPLPRKEDNYRTAFAFAKNRIGKSSIFAFSTDNPSDSVLQQYNEIIGEESSYLKQVLCNITPTSDQVHMLLAVLDIEDNEIAGVQFHDSNEEPTLCWPDAAAQSDTWPNLWRIGIQSIMISDLEFMRNASLICRSMIIQVLPFHAVEEDSEFHALKLGSQPGHFLSYVREDDTYRSFAARIASHTGDSVYFDLKLYIVFKERHHRRRYLPLFENSNSPSDVQHKRDFHVFPNFESSNKKQINSGESDNMQSIWEMYAEYYPDYASYKNEDVTLHRSIGKKVRGAEDRWHYPIAAIHYDVDEDESNIDSASESEHGSRRPRGNNVSSSTSVVGLQRRQSSQITIN
eukprot:GSChrysophyteH1.ASY1.ANO1.3073.1 assembled CDS